MSTARRIRPDEVEDVTAMLCAAFSADPVLRWVWPDDQRWDSLGRDFLRTLARTRVSLGEAWALDDLSAAALWDPPGGRYGDAVTFWKPFEQTLSPGEHERFWAYEAAAAGVHVDVPHWYLGVVGVHPQRQGQGLARQVLRPILDSADRTGIPATLETGNAENVERYRRLGFVPFTEQDVPGGPHVWMMRRDPGAG